MNIASTLSRLLLSPSLKSEIESRYETLNETGKKRLNFVLAKALEHQEKLLQEHSERSEEFEKGFEDMLKTMLMQQAEAAERQEQEGVEDLFDNS